MIENLSKFDLVQWVGSKVCTVGTDATSFLIQQSACSEAEAWNMGALLMIGVAAVIAIVFISRRRQERRDGYYWR
ncbi:MAG: hypothetical protein KBA31_10405 [Alphaproteobacteria bacterium]|nr:hypothetical protein [Alphaproteobacteria bacterium]